MLGLEREAQLTVCQWWRAAAQGPIRQGSHRQETGLWTQAGRKHSFLQERAVKVSLSGILT